jgi:hypothetical protein
LKLAFGPKFEMNTVYWEELNNLEVQGQLIFESADEVQILLKDIILETKYAEEKE